MSKFIIFILIIYSVIIYPGCKNPAEENQNKTTGTMQRPPIEKVIKDHTDEIMGIPGVQGFYQGELENGEPCIIVMVDKKTEENARKIPKELEGYPVTIEETGKIRPIQK